MEEVNYGILKQIPLNQSQRNLHVLDVGCGSGVLSMAIKKKVIRYGELRSTRKRRVRLVKELTRSSMKICKNLKKLKNNWKQPF